MRKLYILILLAFSINTLHSQTILFEENFESFTNSFSLNTIDQGGTASGNNLWVVNNSYFGGDVNVLCPFPLSVPLAATPDQPIPITSNPQSSYLHITSQDGLNSVVDNCHFAAADIFGCNPSENYFARMSNSISTVGQSNVEVSFWWLCSGASGVAYGEVYYSTDNGLTWSTLGIINEYANQSNWIQTTIQNSVLDNQASLMIGFNFVNTSNLFASPTDPAFGVDEFQISSSASTINTIDTDPILLGPYCPGQPISVPFSASGTFSSSNVFTAQLSNSFGLFTSPIAIGTLNGSGTSGVINATIPLGTIPGTLYQIRVIASNPNTIGSPSNVNIEVAGSPTASISQDSYTSICAGGVAFLFFEGSAGEIQWSSSTDNVNFAPIPGANNATLTTSPITQTTYFLVAVTNNCGTTTSQSWAVTLTSTVNIPVNTTPNVLNLCNGPITVSVVGDFFDLVWSNQQAGTAVIVVSSASTVSVVGNDINGCPAASNPLVFIETTPAALSISPASPITICSDPATLTASQGFATYAWSDGEVGMSNSVNSPGSYSVTATDAQGCIVTSSPVIVQNGSSVDIPVSPSISAICDNVPATLTADAGFFNYTWSNGAIGQEITVSLPGFYSVTGTDANGCPGESALVEVIQAQFPVANFTYTQTSGYAITFDNSSQNGLEYEWIFEDLGTSPLANPSFTFPDSGPYQITLIASNPCSSDTITKTIIVTYVGIQDLDESTHFSVSPNPSSDDFIISQHDTNSSISGITLSDISGRVVYQNAQEIKALSKFILPASNLPTGMYFLHFETMNGTVNIRVLKK
jgi:PKD repeat protein